MRRYSFRQDLFLSRYWCNMCFQSRCVYHYFLMNDEPSFYHFGYYSWSLIVMFVFRLFELHWIMTRNIFNYVITNQFQTRIDWAAETWGFTFMIFLKIKRLMRHLHSIKPWIWTIFLNDTQSSLVIKFKAVHNIIWSWVDTGRQK